MKLKLFATTALLALSLGASAQYGDSYETTDYWGPSSEHARAVSATSYEGWSSIWLEYNAAKLDFNKGIDDESLTGFSFGYSQAVPITTSAPVFVETGFGVQYTYKKDFMDADDIKFEMFSCKVPINLIYEFAIPNSEIRVDPFAGVSLRYNISAKLSDDDDDADMFDENDMGKGNTLSRFQAGWQVGLKLRFGTNFMAGVSYGSDFSNIWETDKKSYNVKAKANMTTFTLAFGF